MKIWSVILSHVVLSLNLYAQCDKIICYDINSTKISVLNLNQNHINYNLSISQEFHQNNINFSISEKRNGSRFSEMKAASNFIDNNEFPASSAVKISALNGDTTWDKCSGMFVGENYVLTAAHCVFSDNGEWNDRKIFNKNLYIKPGFDKGNESVFGRYKVSKIYVFQSYITGSSKKDIALLKIDKPKGINTGWVKMKAIDKIDDLMKTSFYNFSYPMDASMLNIDKEYNGDTLYLKTGNIDYADYAYIGIKSAGIPGESGSSLLYNDNNILATCAVRNFSEEKFSFYRLTKEDIDVFYSIIYKDNMTASILSNTINNDVKIYPNPIFEKVFINTDSSISEIEILIVDNKNIEVLNINIEGKKGNFVLSDYKLLPGNYTMLIKHQKHLLKVQRIIIKK